MLLHYYSIPPGISEGYGVGALAGLAVGWYFNCNNAQMSNASIAGGIAGSIGCYLGTNAESFSDPLFSIR